jgi:photosystem II stability/assembly factor-like uncharacterized protein
MISLALVQASASDIIAGDNTWTTTGPYGVRIMDIAIDPENSQIIYATTPDGTVQVYKSTDGGGTWLPSGNGMPEYAETAWGNSIVFDPGDSDILYVATAKGVYKSADGGQNWVLRSTIVESDTAKTIRARSIAISPVDDTVYAGGYDFPFGDDAGGGIFRSEDGGETWERLGNGAPTGTVLHLAVASGAPHIIYAAGYGDVGVYKSMDGGDSWQPINSGFAKNPGVHRLAIDPYDNQVVYISVSGQGVYRTDDGGQSWIPIGVGLNIDVRAMAIDPGNQQNIYAGGGADSGTPGAYRSLDNLGQSWAPMTEGMGNRVVWSLALDQSVPQNIYAGTESGIWKYALVSGPADYSISINDGALFTNQTAVSLALTAPPGTTQMIIGNDGGFSGASWEPFASQKSWEITSVGAYVLPRIVYAKFRTNGQTSGLYQDDIVLDVTAPTGTVEITTTNGSAVLPLSPQLATNLAFTDNLTYTIYLPATAKAFRPGFVQIGLILSASDDLSGVGQMLIGNDANFTDAQWEMVIERKSWWIPDSGPTTVHVKFRDRAGNESDTYTATATP